MAQTRTQGATARAQSWDDLAPAPRNPNGSWLPLAALDDEEVYAGGPRLEAVARGDRRAQIPTRQYAQVAHTTSQRVLSAPAAPRQDGAPIQELLRQAQGKARGRQSEQREQSATRSQVKAMAIAVGGMLALLALYVAVSTVVQWASVKLDDFQYGRPRTSQMDAYVGHGEAEGNPSHFIALNLNRRVTILELPGGDSTKTATIVGPYLFGQGEDLTPVQLNSTDLNSDGKPDLVVSVKNEQLLYLNDGATFKLATPEEQAAIEKAQAARKAAPQVAPQVAPQEAVK
jgi:hypothetical protein